MKNINSAPGNANFDSFWQGLCGLVRQGVDALGAMSWPMLLACAIGLALFITILPLVLTLFLIFLLVKWANNSGGFGWEKKTTQQQPPQ
ncbi:hypothetical protein [Janthinobacterium psychrotolerans]|uniref:Uncharacterized protein n=1 Tax=Janthinobacterium psychrotolerans TaxID=1747903 RepID=A0A1A7C5M1_9BURK|nr:hypothetical protein [Janthinobacterium psychrotolerans]OBV40060.1 hypothetical protein ASR47_1013116 [Janthinobacterium psychrotolerans]